MGVCVGGSSLKLAPLVRVVALSCGSYVKSVQIPDTGGEGGGGVVPGTAGSPRHKTYLPCTSTTYAESFDSI